MQKHTCKCLVLVVFAALTCRVLCSGREQDTADPDLLLAQARKLQDVWSDGTPALRVRTEINILGAIGKTIPGQYVVTWISSSRWTEELEIADYKRVRVHNSKGYWQQSTLTVQPESIFQLDSILDFKSVLKIGTKQALSKVKNRDKDGVRQKCAELKSTTGTERVLCFDEARGNLLSVEYPRAEHQNPPDISRVEYSAFNKVGDKSIPYEARAFRDRTVLVTTKITNVMPITEGDPGLFTPPANSEFWPQCDDMRSPELVNRVSPRYPADARRNGEQGRVVFYAVLETDGTLSHLTPIQRVTPTLELAAADAIRQWRYKPAACDSTPIRLETSIPVDFWLER
jgi:TonB family protein